MLDASVKESLKRFYRFMHPYRFRALTALMFTTVVGSMTGGLPFLLKPYTDDILLPGGRTDSMLYPYVGPMANSPFFFPILIIVYSLIESLVQFAANYLTTWVGKRISMNIKAALFDRLMHSDTATFDQSTSGTVLQRYSLDADAASEGLLNNVKTLIVRVVTSVVLVFVMLFLSPILTLIAVGCLLFAVVPLSRVQKRLKSYIKDTVQSSAQVTTHYNEAFSGNRVITSYNLYDYAGGRLNLTLKRLFRLSIKMVQRTNLLSLVLHAATAVGIAATVYISDYLIDSGSMTPGDFVAFLVALLSLYTPIKKMGNTMSTVQGCFMAIQRILEILDSSPNIVSRPAARRLTGMRDVIRYRDVSFSYLPDKPVLKNISLEIGTGQSVAFVGNSGGGKTTLVNLLPRFYDVDSGAITIDGADVRDIELENLRDLIAIVFQDNFLFGGTIRENILLGKRDATDEQVAAAVRAACLDEFIGSLELGLDTEIGERGVMLSGGQKQRVAIARAFVKDAPIVILDEATSALDNKSEAVVQQAIENLMLNKTVLIIAHRLSTVINADRIVVLKDGEMVESGTHKELIDRGGMYSSLYRTQLA